MLDWPAQSHFCPKASTVLRVARAHVVGVPDPARGQNVAAAIVLDSGHGLDADECRARLREQISSYKVPRHCFFSAKQDLPFTDSGKIDKRKLAALLADRIAAGDAG